MLSFKKIKSKIKNNKIFTNLFGFENGIDITNDNEVLYRKNVVIKNIVFITNLAYTLIFSLLSFNERSNLLLTIILFPLTFVVNYMLSKLINKGANDHLSQTIAMYVSSFYMFLSTIVVYFKLKAGEATYLQECGYILLYYSLTITAFYQDKKMLKNVFLWVMVLVTILHFTVTYNVIFSDTAMDANLLLNFLVSNEFKDILIRTILLAMFMLLLYIYVSMANYMQDERKEELVKRRKVQEDFTDVVTKIFDVTLNQNKVLSIDKSEGEILARMSSKLSSLLGNLPDETNDIVQYSTVHIDKSVDFNPNMFQTEDEKFEALRKQTELGSELISRLQLERKCEEIIRATFEGSNNDEFTLKMRKIQNDNKSQIILICDLYLTMRSVRTYKKAYSHKNTMTYMNDFFKVYFDPIIFDRFIRFSNDFEEIYNEM